VLTEYWYFIITSSSSARYLFFGKDPTGFYKGWSRLLLSTDLMCDLMRLANLNVKMMDIDLRVSEKDFAV